MSLENYILFLLRANTSLLRQRNGFANKCKVSWRKYKYFMSEQMFKNKCKCFTKEQKCYVLQRIFFYEQANI